MYTPTQPRLLPKLVAAMLYVATFAVTTVSNAQTVQGAYAGNDPSLPAIDVYYYVGPIPVGKSDDVTGADVSVDFIDVPSGVSITASIAEATSTSVADAFFSDTFSFSTDTNFVQVVNGLRTPAAFAPNPDGRSTEIAVHQLDNVRRHAAHPDSVDLIVYHGSTDAPAIDVQLRSGATVAAGLSYGDRSTAYFAVRAGDTVIVDVARTADATTLGSFVTTVPSGFAGRAGFLMIRGFVDPASNGNGREFGVTLVPASGAALDFGPEVSTANGDAPRIRETSLRIESLYPHPVVGRASVDLQAPSGSRVSVRVFDMLGREMLATSVMGGENRFELDAGQLATGLYNLIVESNGKLDYRAFVVR